MYRLTVVSCATKLNRGQSTRWNDIVLLAFQKSTQRGRNLTSCSWSLSRISASAVCHSSAKITGSFPASSAGRTTCSLIKGGADSANYAAFRPLRHTLPPDDGR